METAYYILAGILIFSSILPFIPHPHWIFRLGDFGRIQVFIMQIMLISFGFGVFEEFSPVFLGLQIALIFFVVYSGVILIQYTSLYKNTAVEKVARHSRSISIISVNVYQFNNEYQRLIDLVQEVQPDILLTMESNLEWEQGMAQFEKDFTNYKKIALENTYGMHFYTNLNVKELKVNYFIADDLPSIEAVLETEDGDEFTFFGVHPPPPSPTEEDTSRERDGELLSVAKRAKKYKIPVVVTGDFNNVAWAKSSILFRKTSELIDPRIGRGFVSTFHAKYRLLRFPIDLFFHSTDVFIEEFKTLRPIGSDHLPLYSKFFLNYHSETQEEEVEELEKGEMEEVNEMIEEGKEEESDRPAVASE